MEFSPSFTVWTYDIKRLIARGAYGDIHEVVTDSNVTCAAKTIKLPLQLGETKPEIMKKLDRAFDSEKRLCVLDHRNIVKFYDMTIHTKESSIMVFMELVNGPTLDKYIGGKPLNEKTIRTLAVQICSALNYLHTLKSGTVLHRDINSRTIMVGEGDTIKLIDFGLAIQLVESASDHMSTNPRGDPCFMAPELFLSDETEDTPYSCASDIWAFGCTVYHMASGHKPHYDCKNMLAIVRRVKRQGAPVIPSTCSDALKNFYEHCTATDRRDRKSAAQLLQHDFFPSRRALAPPHEQTVPVAGSLLELEFSTAEKEPPESYSMTPPSKGLCLVINVGKYQDQVKFPSLPKSTNDINRIRGAFDQLGFKVEVLDGDLKANDIWNVIHGTASSLQSSGYDCFVCLIMAHGAKDRIYASDGETICLEDVMKRFQAVQCAGLKGKPKLFFVQSPQEPHKPVIYLSDSDFLLCGGNSFVLTLYDIVENETFRHVGVDNIIGEVARLLGRAPEKKQSVQWNTSSTFSEVLAFPPARIPSDAAQNHDFEAWEQGRELGRGSFGTVYEASIKDKKIAVKVIEPQYDCQKDPADVLERIVSVERRLLGLNHENLMKVFHVLADQDKCTVMSFIELLDGTTLYQFIHDFKARSASIDGLPEKIVMQFSVQICNALRYLHGQERAVIHRDINGRNIMVLKGSNCIKLIDFGLTIALKKETTHFSAASKQPYGTLRYMAPEVLGSEKRIIYSPESDIWAFGCVVYHMVTGRVPHAELTNDWQVVLRIQKSGAPTLPAKSSSQLQDFYASCVDKSRKRRKTAEQLLQGKFCSSWD